MIINEPGLSNNGMFYMQHASQSPPVVRNKIQM